MNLPCRPLPLPLQKKRTMFDFTGIALKEIVTVSFTLFAVIDMLGSIPVLVSLKEKFGARRKSPGSELASQALSLACQRFEYFPD